MTRVPRPTNPTREQIVRALQEGGIRDVPVVITKWLLNGSDGGNGPATGRADQIEYEFLPVDSRDKDAIFLGPVQPFPRRYSETTVIGAAPGEPALVRVYNGYQTLVVDESPHPVDCDGELMGP